MVIGLRGENVMTIAWSIAREAVKKFGGNIKEFFSQALKLAWGTIKGWNNVEKLIKKFRIKLTAGDNLKCDMWAAEKYGSDEIKAKKGEIVSYLKAKKEAEEEAYAERRFKIDSIEGLKELQDALTSHNMYRIAWSNYIDNGAIGKAPVKPEANIEELKVKYPRAVAYIRADDFADSTHFEKSSIGRKALERIINGEDYENVIKEMNAEWSAYGKKHLWD